MVRRCRPPHFAFRPGLTLHFEAKVVMRSFIAPEATVSLHVRSLFLESAFDATRHAFSTAPSDSPAKESICSYSPAGIEMVVRPSPPALYTDTCLKASLSAGKGSLGSAAAGAAGERDGLAAAGVSAEAFGRL